MHEALGALTVALADSPTTQARRALPESSTESTFAEVLADSPTTQGQASSPGVDHREHLRRGAG